jgi:multidrug transporter EmrE-like cation transporter
MLAAKIILVLLTSLTASLGNTLLKVGASRAGDEQLELRRLPRTLLGPAVLAGAALYGLSQLLWITILRIEDLSMVYPLMIGLNFVLIMAIAWSYFKEPVSVGKLAGIVLIFVGVAAVATG